MRSRALLLLLLASCGSPTAQPRDATTAHVTIVGTNDLHGHVRALPLLAGYLANLRRAHEVVLVDAGDLFQGTLESNLEEGASVVRAYDALAYDAATIGNHEFDYGPVGANATVRAPGEDPLGALRARIGEAHFPFVSTNLLVSATGERAELGVPSVVLERAGLRIGVIGVTTEQTLGVTIAANVAELAIRPPAPAIEAEARSLRERGAQIVIVAAHAGGRCTAFDDPDDLSSCEADEEIFRVARALAPGTVDVIVGGHSHQAVAHRVNGIAIIESWSYGAGFGRVDLAVDRATGRIVDETIHPPHRLCSAEGANAEDGLETCAPGDYEGAPVVPDARIASVIAPAVERASALRDRDLGVAVLGEMPAHRNFECALGNLFVDLMLRARPGVDVAIINGGGLRAALPEGPLRYGAFYEAFPFDNRFAIVRATGAELRAMYAAILGREGSFFSIGGMRVEGRCEHGALAVVVTRADGRVVHDEDAITILTSDFLATGGDGIFATIREREGAVTLEDDPPIREAMIEALHGTTQIDPATYLSSPRVRFPGERPVRCD